MKKYKSGFLFASVCFYAAAAHAQDTLGLSAVIAKTLESNYQVQVSQIQIQQSGNLATRGQAGFYPQINANGSGAFSQNNTRLEFAGGLPDVERNGAINTSYGANVGLNYTVFNGFGRVRTYQGLIKQLQLSQVQAKLLSENLVLEVVNRYINYQQARTNLQLSNENLRVSKSRLQLAQKGYETGVKSVLDVLSADLDLRNDSLLVLQSTATVKKELHALNVLMGVEPGNSLFIGNEMPVPVLDAESVLVERLKGNNTSVLLAKLGQEMAETQLGIAQSRQLPTLNVSANYGFVNSQNGAGIILAQQNLGFNSSASLVVPIFNGKQLRNAIQNARLDVEIRGLELEQAQLQALQLLYDVLEDQKVLEQQIVTLSNGVTLAKKALFRAEEAYKVGQIRYNDLRQAQTNLLQAESSLQNTRLNLLRLRFGIKRILGELLD